jgi:hypothetical protein
VGNSSISFIVKLVSWFVEILSNNFFDSAKLILDRKGDALRFSNALVIRFFPIPRPKAAVANFEPLKLVIISAKSILIVPVCNIVEMKTSIGIENILSEAVNASDICNGEFEFIILSFEKTNILSTFDFNCSIPLVACFCLKFPSKEKGVEHTAMVYIPMLLQI